MDDNVMMARKLCQRGLDALHNGRCDEAETAFMRAIEACPVDQEARQHYADSLWRRGETDRAILQMSRAVQLSGADPKMVVQLGKMHLDQGNLRDSLHHANMAIRTESRLAKAWVLRGDVLHRQGKMQSAQESYHRALSYSSDEARVRLELAEIYGKLGQPRRALLMLQNLAEQFESGKEPQRVLYLQGLALKALQRHEDAREQLTLASRRGPPTAEIMYHLAEMEWLVGDLAAARHATKEARRLGADEGMTHALAARIEATQTNIASTPRR